uniref:Ig-like domain-containing protein n=1 Tax=Callorhinchus milii TaxID=7868 RepID=A0A4W3H580_CALMI
NHSSQLIPLTLLLLIINTFSIFFLGVLATENGNSTEYIQTLGGKVTLNCSESYLNTIGVKEYKSIISHDCLSNRIQTYNNTRVTTPNTTCNAPSKDFYLQIESVDVTDEGEYKCDIATRKGNFQKIFSLTVIVPPNISISCENNSNGTKTAVCTASNGKPKGNITWQPTNEENIISTVENSNSTVTVQSKYIITDTSNYKGHLTCIVTHPALKERLNYVFPLCKYIYNKYYITDVCC